MDLKQVLAVNVESAHDAFTQTVADVTQEMADWVPPGVMHPIGERYVHLVLVEDMLVNAVAKGGAPLFVSTWAGRTGFSAALDMVTALTAEKAREFRVRDLNALAQYTRAVFENTQAYINDANEAQLTSSVDMQVVGRGNIPFPIWFSMYIVGHCRDVMGEISALKGCLGAKGYPF
jgi:hypothetical protein